MRGDCGGGPFSSEVGNITSCLTTALTGKSMLLTRTEDTEDASPAMRASWTTGRGVAVDRTEAEMGISIGDPLAAVVKAFGDGKGREHSVTTGESGTNEVLRGLLAGLLADEDRERLDQAVQGGYRWCILGADLKRAFCHTSEMPIFAEMAFQVEVPNSMAYIFNPFPLRSTHFMYQYHQDPRWRPSPGPGLGRLP